MRYLILSDIHANREALEAVVRHAHGGYETVLCCGDVVGYGADPNAVTNWVRVHVAAIVRGNHDKVCVGLEDSEWFNPVARAAADWTRRELTEKNLEWLRALPKGPFCVDSFAILHGSPADEDEYVVSVGEAAQMRSYLPANTSFFGHTHLQGGFLCHRNGVRRLEGVPERAEHLTLQLEPGVDYLINPGSVGQPRDRDPRAAYAIYDSDRREVEYRRTSYPVAKAQQKIFRAGLPPILGERLEFGT